MSRNSLKIFQIIASATLLTAVAWMVGLFDESGRAEFLQMLGSANIIILCASIAVGVAVNLSSALKWFMLVRAKAMRVGYWRVFSYYLVGQFYNIFLPTSVGGDVVRSYQLGKYTGQQADALASVFVERYTGVLVLLVLAGLAVLNRLSIFSVDFVIVSLVAFALILTFVAWMIFDDRLYSKFKTLITDRFSASHSLFTKLDKLLLSVQVYKHDKSAIAWAFVNSLVFYLLAVSNVYITSLVFSGDLTFADALIATPIIMLVMNLPISMGNIGLMEFAYSSVFQLMGYSPALGLSVALLMRLKSLLDGAMGGVLQPFFVGRNAAINS